MANGRSIRVLEELNKHKYNFQRYCIMDVTCLSWVKKLLDIIKGRKTGARKKGFFIFERGILTAKKVFEKNNYNYIFRSHK